MLMVVKNQIKVMLLTMKYSIMREMLNKATFLSNVFFMILNDATFLIQWLLLFRIKGDIGGSTMSDVLLIWSIATASYGVSRFFFYGAFGLSELITDGKIDSFLVQPKNVLLSIITSKTAPSALGDLIYGFLMLAIYGLTIKRVFLYILLSTCGGIILVSISVFYSSLSFWFSRTESITDQMNTLMINFASYPEGIYKGVARIILFTIIPVGFVNYLPVRILRVFDIKYTLIVLGVTLLIALVAYATFNRGLKRYSSSNLMSAKV